MAAPGPLRLCISPDCTVSFASWTHSHCCSRCRKKPGRHSRRCILDQRQAGTLPDVGTCATTRCQRLVSGGHVILLQPLQRRRRNVSHEGLRTAMAASQQACCFFFGKHGLSIQTKCFACRPKKIAAVEPDPLELGTKHTSKHTAAAAWLETGCDACSENKGSHGEDRGLWREETKTLNTKP